MKLENYQMTIAIVVSSILAGCSCVAMTNKLEVANDSASEARAFAEIVSCPSRFEISFFDNDGHPLASGQLGPNYSNVDVIEIKWFDLKRRHKLIDQKNLRVLLVSE